MSKTWKIISTVGLAIWIIMLVVVGIARITIPHANLERCDNISSEENKIDCMSELTQDEMILGSARMIGWIYLFIAFIFSQLILLWWKDEIKR